MSGGISNEMHDELIGAKHQIVGVGCTDFKRLRKDTRQKIVSALSKVEDTTL